MTSPLEILRFKWKPLEMRLLLAALHDKGPVQLDVWSRRTGIPRNHLLDTVRETERKQGIMVEMRPEGLWVGVQPPAMWKERSLLDESDWKQAWQGASQERLSIASEMPNLADALAVTGSPSPPESGWVDPESGADNRNPVPSFNVQRLTPQKGSEEAFNVERLTEPTGIRMGGWMAPETEAEAMTACKALLGADDMRLWGGRWRNRWRENSAKLVRVLAAVRQEQMEQRKPSKSWGACASDMWGRFAD